MSLIDCRYQSACSGFIRLQLLCPPSSKLYRHRSTRAVRAHQITFPFREIAGRRLEAGVRTVIPPYVISTRSTFRSLLLGHLTSPHSQRLAGQVHFPLAFYNYCRCLSLLRMYTSGLLSFSPCFEMGRPSCTSAIHVAGNFPSDRGATLDIHNPAARRIKKVGGGSHRCPFLPPGRRDMRASPASPCRLRRSV